MFLLYSNQRFLWCFLKRTKVQPVRIVLWSWSCLWIRVVPCGVFYLACGTAQKEICYLVNEVEKNFSEWEDFPVPVSYGPNPSTVSVRFLALSLYQNHNWQSRKSEACLCSKRKENLGTELCWGTCATKRQQLLGFTTYTSVSGKIEEFLPLIEDTALGYWLLEGVCQVNWVGQAGLISVRHLWSSSEGSSFVSWDIFSSGTSGL